MLKKINDPCGKCTFYHCNYESCRRKAYLKVQAETAWEIIDIIWDGLIDNRALLPENNNNSHLTVVRYLESVVRNIKAEGIEKPESEGKWLIKKDKGENKCQ